MYTSDTLLHSTSNVCASKARRIVILLVESSSDNARSPYPARSRGDDDTDEYEDNAHFVSQYSTFFLSPSSPTTAAIFVDVSQCKVILLLHTDRSKPTRRYSRLTWLSPHLGTFEANISPGHLLCIVTSRLDQRTAKSRHGHSTGTCHPMVASNLCLRPISLARGRTTPSISA